MGQGFVARAIRASASRFRGHQFAIRRCRTRSTTRGSVGSAAISRLESTKSQALSGVRGTEKGIALTVISDRPAVLRMSISFASVLVLPRFRADALATWRGPPSASQAANTNFVSELKGLPCQTLSTSWPPGRSRELKDSQATAGSPRKKTPKPQSTAS